MKNISHLLIYAAAGFYHLAPEAGHAMRDSFIPTAPEALTLRVSPEREILSRRGSREVIVQVEVEARPSDRNSRAPMNLAVVLDHSGSMSGAKIEKARQAACVAVDQLDASDVFSLVIYDSRAEVLIPPQRLETQRDRDAVKARINRIQPDSGTGLHAGVVLGAEQLRRFMDKERINRIVLLSDGLANEGPSQPGQLADLGRDLRREGMSVSTIGLGDDYNEDLMTALAESSHANYYYVQDAEKLPGIFSKELGAARSVLARTVIIRIEAPEGVRLREILGHPEVRCEGRTAEITMPEYFGSDRRRFLVKCTVDSSDVDRMKIADVALSYDDATSKQRLTQNQAATVAISDDEIAVEKSLRPEISKEVAVLENRIDKEEAVRLADAGKAREATELLRSRAAQNAAAPVAQQLPNVAEENRKLEATASEISTQGTLLKSSRKQVQWENYQDKYQKRSASH